MYKVKVTYKSGITKIYTFYSGALYDKFLVNNKHSILKTQIIQ